MRSLGTLLIVVLCWTESLGQDLNSREIDSLIQVLEKQPSDTSKVNTLILLGTQYLWINDNQSVQYGKDAVELAEKLKFKTGQAYALRLLGLGYARLGNMPQADSRLKAALAIFEEMGSKDGVSKILSNLGNLYSEIGYDTKSIEYFLESLKVAEEINNKLRIATNLNNIGSVYANKQETYTDAINYYLKALTILEEIDYSDLISMVSINIAEIYYKMNLYETAIPFFEKALEIDRGTSYSAWSLSHLGSINAELGDFEKAFEYHNEAVEISESQNAKLELAQSLLMQAKSLDKKGDFVKSINAYRKAQEVSEEINARQEQRQAYDGLFNAYGTIGDYKNAYTFGKLHSQIKDTLAIADSKKLTESLEFQKKLIETQFGLELQVATIQRQRIINVSVLGILLLVVVAGGLSFRFFQMRRVKRIIEKEKDRSEKLLLNILPHEVAEELKAFGESKAKHFDKVTVLFTDFKDFTSIANALDASDLVAEINVCFKAFDQIIVKYGIEKIKTIGDSYMAAGGLGTTDGSTVPDVVKAGLEMQSFMLARAEELKAIGKQGFEMRVGIHTGAVVAGIVGVKKFQYDIWGDTVNIASRMESSGEVGKVNISEATYEHIRNNTDFTFQSRGKIQAKNIGSIEMFFVDQV